MADRRRATPSEAATDVDLAAAVRAGSKAAFAILYDRYRPMAVRMAWRALSSRNRSQAEDVAEVALASIYDALRRGRGPDGDVRSYLAVTIKREAARQQRVRDREPLIDSNVVELRDAPSDLAAVAAERVTPGPEAALDPDLLLTEVFRGLSDRFRYALWLSEVEGRSPAEVAPMLGLTPNAAAALFYRARRALRAGYFRAYEATCASATCRPLIPQLAAYVEAGQPTEGHDVIRAHLEGCASCRAIARGVSPAHAALAAAAPFGLLSLGCWLDPDRPADGRGADPVRARAVRALGVALIVVVLAAVFMAPRGGDRERERASRARTKQLDGGASQPPSSGGPRRTAVASTVPSAASQGASSSATTPPASPASTPSPPPADVPTTTVVPPSAARGGIRGVLTLDPAGTDGTGAIAAAGTPVRVVDATGRTVWAQRTDLTGGFSAANLAPGPHQVWATLPVGYVLGDGSPGRPPTARREVLVATAAVVPSRESRADAMFVPWRRLVVSSVLGPATGGAASAGTELVWDVQVRSTGTSTDGVEADLVVDTPSGTQLQVVQDASRSRCTTQVAATQFRVTCDLERLSTEASSWSIRLRVERVGTAGHLVPSLRLWSTRAAAVAAEWTGTPISVAASDGHAGAADR